MSKNLSIASLEPRSGKSIVALGFMEQPSGHLKNVGLFRPVVAEGSCPDRLIHAHDGSVPSSYPPCRPVRCFNGRSIVAHCCKQVYPVHEPEHLERWADYIRQWVRDHDVAGKLTVLTEGPSSKHPETNHRMQIIDLSS